MRQATGFKTLASHMVALHLTLSLFICWLAQWIVANAIYFICKIA